jgi:lipopolysaccharide/colanic/teichoic acid biosynthesis glycosyltransferase
MVIHTMSLRLRVFKRLCDVGFILLMAMLFWLLALIWLTVRLTSPGPGLFWQDRVGRGGEVFRCVKFRTMATGTKSMGTHLVSPAVVTRVGRVLRATKLDELPQAWNILRGEMSLVGPRPCLPNQTELIAARQAVGALDVTPGITGWAQVHGVDMSDPDRLAEWDRAYIDNLSIARELRIMLMTAKGGGMGDKVAGPA